MKSAFDLFDMFVCVSVSFVVGVYGFWALGLNLRSLDGTLAYGGYVVSMQVEIKRQVRVRGWIKFLQ